MASRKCFSLPVSCLLVLVLSACATLSKNECLNADWYHLGTQDGAAGYPQGRLLEHYEACAEYGIRPDDAKYLTGRSDGLVAYCQPANAIREGLAGRVYQGVCPPSVHLQFADLNRIALSVRAARQGLDSLASRQDALEHELHHKKTSEDRKRRIRAQLRDLDRELDAHRNELRWREYDLDRAYMAPWR